MELKMVFTEEELRRAMANVELLKAAGIRVVVKDEQEQLQQLREEMENLRRQIGEAGTLMPEEKMGSLEMMMQEAAVLPAPAEIKRQLKHEKNPMRIRELNRQLQKSYKAYRGGDKGGNKRKHH